jgi:methylenetetrahydrofolate dehydrogenase (NADP+) / methenyltetrahydrofolate cyclohydrolase
MARLWGYFKMKLEGKVVFEKITKEVRSQIKKLKFTPNLAIISFQARSDSQGYLMTREKLAKDLGVKLTVINYKTVPSEDELIKQIIKLNKDSKIHGIIIDRPLPKKLNEFRVFSAIDVNKDIDGCHPLNSGYLLQGYDGFTPNTSAAVMAILKHYKIKLKGADVIVIGRSKNVGLPMFPLLLRENASVTICHKLSKNIPEKAKQAEIIIVAVGVPNFINSKFVNKNSIVIDIGTNYLKNNHVVGDVDPKIYKSIKAYSPVPGGVGPVTNIILFSNLVEAIKKNHAK